MTGMLALLSLVPLAWFFLRRPKTPVRTLLRVPASSLWMLDHFCISLRSVLQEWPELKEVRVSLERLGTLDDGSIASLKRAIEVASAARVKFCVDGYDASMARLAMARGIDAQHLGTPRAALKYPREQIH